MFEIHPAALDEAAEARDWYDERSVQAGDRFETALDDIERFPLRWPAGVLKTRFLTLDTFPYSVICQPRASDVVVLAVDHASRRPSDWKTRLS